MDKVQVGLIGTTIVAASAAPTTFLMSDGSLEDYDQFPWPEWRNLKLISLKKSSDIGRKYKDIGCLKTSYGTGDEWKGETQGDDSPSLTSIKEDASDLKGCLIIENYRKEQSGKWKGGFKLVWSISSAQEGFITTLNANTNEGKLIIDASAYILVQNNGTWFFKYKSENINKVVSEDNELNNYFPKPGNSINQGDSAKYFGFDPKINKICKGSECPGGQETFTSIAWDLTKGNNDTNTITDWCENFDTWFTGLFPKWTQIKEKLQKIKGTWSLQGLTGKGG